MSQEWQKQFSFGQAKNSTPVLQLCKGCEIADYPCIVVENLDGSLVATLCAKYALVRGSGGMPPWYLGSLRVHLLAIQISVSQAQINN